MALESVYGEVLTTSDAEGSYDEANDSYALVLKSLLPIGPAWLFDTTSDFWNLLQGMSYSFLRIHNRGHNLLQEFDPRTTYELLSDWERVLGLPGANPTPPTTLGDRREAVHARLLGHGDPTPAFFIELALGLGYTAIIKHKEYNIFVPGSPAGDPLTQGEWPYFWKLVTAPGTQDATVTWLVSTLVPNHTDELVIFLGEDWVEQLDPKNFALRGIAVDESNRFVAVGDADGTDPYIITSDDEGDKWAERAMTGPKNIGLNAVSFDTDGDDFIAVGDADGADALILVSLDNGVTWAEKANGSNLALYGIANNASPLGALWVAAGQNTGTNPYITTSSNAGTTWTTRTPDVAKNVQLNGVAFGLIFVAVGEVVDGTDPYIVWSANGTTGWTIATPTVAKAVALNAVAYGNGVFVAVGDADGATDTLILTSDDSALVWTERANPKNFALHSIVYAAAIKLWVGVGAADGTDPYIVTSVDDGVTWVEQGPASAKNLAANSVTYDNGVLVAVGGADGTDAYILTSGVDF